VAVDILELLELTVEALDKIGADVLPSNAGGAIAPNLSSDLMDIKTKLNELKENLK
jgi:hypothetical protein